MEYTIELMSDFLRKVKSLDQEMKRVIEERTKKKRYRIDQERIEAEDIKKKILNMTCKQDAQNKELLIGHKKEISSAYCDEIEKNRWIYERINKCEKVLSHISNAEQSITNTVEYEMYKTVQTHFLQFTIEDFFNETLDISGWAYAADMAIRNEAKKKEAIATCSYFYSVCRYAEQLINQELDRLHTEIKGYNSLIHEKSNSIDKDYSEKIDLKWNQTNQEWAEMSSQSAKSKYQIVETTEKNDTYCDRDMQSQLDIIARDFCAKFSPEKFLEEYIRILNTEPNWRNYTCATEMPGNLHINTIEYDISSWGLCSHAKRFLEKNFYFIYCDDKVHIPYCLPLNSEFNLMFKYNENQKAQPVKDACAIGLRLFSMIPPGKVNFTFIDPVGLGESFAMFGQLVSTDDRTSEVINGKIWSAPSDIEEKLRVMTDHISNITQRCLQGKYPNIFEYNKVADQNAEPYQVLMLMDFPAGLSDQSLRLIEQISTSGPKCGVFTVIYNNQNQHNKVSERSLPLVKNIENGFNIFEYTDVGKKVICPKDKIDGKNLLWSVASVPDGEQRKKLIETLKKGIKNADKVVIGIDKVSHAESTNSTKDGIRIPIGIHGANEVQYLSLGVGGSHHALIAGVAGSGKSSLLHTIILRALTQYSPEELVIYLVDFKRGVEFKIYADFELPSFKVIAIESEREFGYNILMSLEREQKIRADLFKKAHVDKIEEYREIPGKKMPRVLVIMDEFHELFSSANDEFGKKSAQIMERIVRQGRAFGVHMILASQSYSNISGIDRAVFDQMAVRIVLKCSKADANLLLDNGSNEIDLISIDDPGRAVYNSEAGNKEYNSHFRVAYIAPEKHRGMLQEISDGTRRFLDKSKPTRILLSNIEDNQYSIFNQFTSYDAANYATPSRLYIGEPLSVNNNMPMDLTRSEHSNILMIGGDTDKARSMFAFAMLSLCINYRIKHGKAPEKPFIYLLNCKPLEDSYFTDIPKLMAIELLSSYICNIPCWDNAAVGTVLTELYENVTDPNKALGAIDKYFFVFGYQRAESLKSEAQNSSHDDVFGSYDMMSSSQSKVSLSNKKMMEAVLTHGAEKGVHTILWHDSYQALNIEDNKIGSYFTMKVAFDMPPEEFSRFVGANDISLMSENNAIYYNRARDNQKFRPYQAPDEEWLREISEKLQ